MSDCQLAWRRQHPAGSWRVHGQVGEGGEERTASDDAETLYLAGNVGGRGAVFGFILREQGVLVSHRARDALAAGSGVLAALHFLVCVRKGHSSATRRSCRAES